MEQLKRGLAVVAAALLCLAALALSGNGFQRVLDFRMLERIPLTSVLGSTGGESQLQGRVEADQLLKAPRSHAGCVYYRYLVEEEYRDSDGDRHWRTITDESRAVDFYLTDTSGSAYIRAQAGQHRVDWSVTRRYRKTSGDYRYTEWRIDPGDKITVFGWLHMDDELPDVTFVEDGDYLPIISSFGGSAERSDISASAIVQLWGGISLLVLMCFALIYALRQHRVLVFLVLVTISSSGLLVSYGMQSLEADVEAGFRRVETQRQSTEKLISSVLARYQIRFPGWQQPFDLNSAAFAALPALEREKINNWRNTAYQVRARYLQQIRRFPEKPYALLRGKAAPLPIALPTDQQRIADAAVNAYRPTRVGQQLLLTLAALVLIGVLAWLAFRLIKTKRMQENLPTSKTAGVVFGLTELKGTLVEENPDGCLTGPVSGRRCTWYHYVIQEKRGSGKKERWVTILDETRKQPFYCEDDEGRLRVFPAKAEVITRHRTHQRRGSKRYTETRLEPGDALYLLGRARADKTTGDSLVLSHDRESPYIIANRSEAEVMFMKASKAMLLLSLGISLLFGVGLWIGGSNGNFSSVDFLMASLIAPAFLTVLMVVLMYNDLVFLRQRCERNWANIDVSLKKRAELIPQLERVVQRYLQHEAGLQQALAQLRNQRTQVHDVPAADAYMAAEARVIDELALTLEQYPDLKGHLVLADFNRRLIKLENEIALIRAGFNDAVMQYNTRLQSFPDNLLARLGHFKPVSALQFAGAAHQVPVIDLEQGAADSGAA